MSNPNNESTYYSSNHGVGRFLDKHVAKKEFNNENTEEELKKRNMKLYRVGKGNISEQNPNAFKICTQKLSTQMTSSSMFS